MTERTVKTHNLQDFLDHLKGIIGNAYGFNTYYVMAEISGLKFKSEHEHCYMDLIDTNNGVTTSKINGVIWSTQMFKVHQKLKKANIHLKNGLKTIFAIQVKYDIKFGLSLKIIDLDVNFIKGAIEIKKEEIRHKLISENLYSKNKSLPVPFLIKRIAVIGAKGSAGLIDFLKVLSRHSNNIGYDIIFLESAVQGAYAKGHILRHLSTIEDESFDYDAVFLMRGGGSSTDLDCFNDYDLCAAICNCRHPFFVGIGHSTDKVLIDEIAYHSAITPTDLANFINDIAVKKLKEIEKFQSEIFETAQDTLDIAHTSVNKSMNAITDVKYTINELNHSINNKKQKIFQAAKSNTSNLRHDINEHKDVVLNTKSELQRIDGKVAKLQNKIMNTAELTLRYRDIDINSFLEDISEKPETTIQKLSQGINLITGSVLFRSQASMQRAAQSLNSAIDSVVYKGKTGIRNITREFESLETKIHDRNPENLFKRGYSMTLLNGKGVKDVSKLSSGTEVTTVLSNGKFISTISEIQKGENNGI